MITKDESEISENIDAKPHNKLVLFAEVSDTRKLLILTMVATHGVKQKAHSGIVSAETPLDELFTT